MHLFLSILCGGIFPPLPKKLSDIFGENSSPLSAISNSSIEYGVVRTFWTQKIRQNSPRFLTMLSLHV